MSDYNFSKITEQMLRCLPSWMEMRKDPNSIGAQFLNVFGLEFEEIKEYLDEQLDNQFIGTANLGEIDIIYRGDIGSQETPSSNIQVSHDGTPLIKVETIKEFYETENEKAYIVNYNKGLIYTKKDYYTEETIYIIILYM